MLSWRICLIRGQGRRHWAVLRFSREAVDLFQWLHATVRGVKVQDGGIGRWNVTREVRTQAHTRWALDCTTRVVEPIMTYLLLLMACGFLQPNQGLDLEPLRNVMDGLQGDLKDVELIYEGNLIAVDKGGTPDTPESVFQGTFAYRADASAHLDIYRESPGQKAPLSRKVLVLSKGALEELSFVPDSATSSSRRPMPGGLASLDRAESPLRLFLVPRLMQFLRDTGGIRTWNHLRYDCQGWEEIGGHRCLKIRFSRTRSEANAGKYTGYVYWLDMERGGTPIQYHNIVNDVIWSFSDHIELEAFSLSDGKTYWLPVRGRAGTYLDRKALIASGRVEGIVSARNPTYLENYNVMRDTVELNQGLPDRRFSIDWSGSARTARLRSAQARLDAALRQSKSPAPERIIDAVLAEADDQARLLDASAPSRERWSGTTLGMLLLTVVGSVSLSIAAYLKWTRS